MRLIAIRLSNLFANKICSLLQVDQYRLNIDLNKLSIVLL